MSKVLVLTTEPLPVPGMVTTGAGLRAWGLAEGLRANGVEAIVGAPVIPGEPPPQLSSEFSHVRFFHRDRIAKLLDEVKPEAVVLQHWGLAAEVPELTVPLAIDLAGPHLLERLYWGSGDPRRDLEEKLAALRRADFVTCSGHYQRQYFYPFLMMAGFDIRNTEVPVIPFSVPPPVADPASRTSVRNDVNFVYGGTFLAWQDPTRQIKWLLEEMDALDTGRLLFYGGTHPVLDASGGRFTELSQLLSRHRRVEMRGWKPFDELLNKYRHEGDVALDLMDRNPERELAFTTRTMIYLHCGLPVIYNDYSEVSDIVRHGDAGWTLDPDNEKSFREIVRGILRKEIALEPYRAHAAAAAAKYDWTKTCAPLVEFCRNPKMRKGRVEFALAVEQERHRTEAAQPRTVSFVQKLRMKIRPGWLLSPFVYLIGWLIVLYMRLRLRNSIRE